MPFSMWASKRAREAAEAQFGRENYKHYVFARRLPYYLAVAFVASAAYGGYWLLHNMSETWRRYILIGLAIFAMLVLKMTVFKKRYKIPKRPGRHWWSRW